MGTNFAELAKEMNNDEVSRFWAELLTISNAYMGLCFAGNFMLRNSCVKQIAPIFFACSGDKYEELALKNLQDYMTFLQELLPRAHAQAVKQSVSLSLSSSSARKSPDLEF